MLMLMTFTTQFSFDTFIKMLTVRKSKVILKFFLTIFKSIGLLNAATKLILTSCNQITFVM